MKKNKANSIKIRLLTTMLLAGMLFGSFGCGSRGNTVEQRRAKAEKYLLLHNPSPEYGSVGGEWLMAGLSNAGVSFSDEYKENYLKTVKDAVRETGGILEERKYTEYSRVVLALSALGEDPSLIEGYDLTKPLMETERVALQGVTGLSWGIIALEAAGEYQNKKTRSACLEAEKEMIALILREELEEGGWSLMGEQPDADVTAMCIIALSQYPEKTEALVKAQERGIEALSALQQPDGSYCSEGEETAESTAQVFHALCAEGIDVEKDERFIKQGASILDGLDHFAKKDGSYSHLAGQESDEMATEQVYYALGFY